MNPVVAIFLGAVFRSEAIGPRELLASGVIVVAVAMIVFARSRASRVEAAEDAEGLDAALVDRRLTEEAASLDSARIVRLIRRAMAMIPIIGFTPVPVGNVEPSAT